MYKSACLLVINFRGGPDAEVHAPDVAAAAQEVAHVGQEHNVPRPGIKRHFGRRVGEQLPSGAVPPSGCAADCVPLGF